MSDAKRTDGKFLLGFFIGGLIGALTIFFLGTKEGKKTGKLIREKGEDIIDDVQEKIGELENKGKELVREGESIKEKMLDSLEDKKDEITGNAAEKLESALAHIEALQEHGRQTTANLRKRIFKNLPKKT
ncbi:YtxH domain-containing protein [Candidatus Gottesmanbacteria bacterium]|nr:YtxH domain-containing protein [Candidatus Gottesmanbacteria bacterium]